MFVPQPDARKTISDSRTKKLPATGSIKTFLLICHNFFWNILYENWRGSLSGYCHGAVLQSVLNFENF